MKEFIYRRDEGGFAFVRCAVGVSEAQRNAIANQAYPATVCMESAATTTDEIGYLQFRLSDGRVVLMAHYRDAAGSRQSKLYQFLVTEDEAETRALFEGYPCDVDYFGSFREHYAQVDSLEDMTEGSEVSIETFLSGGRSALQKACQLLKEVFGTPELLAATFDAMLDVASKNQKMLELLGPQEESAAAALRGKRIIEALLACMPPVLATHIGYICPECNDKGNALLGMRYSGKRTVLPSVRQFSYVCDLVQRQCAAPGRPNHSAQAYAAELAQLVFQGDDAALRRLRQLRDALDDAELYENADVPAGIALRYRFLNGVDGIPDADRKTWLDWHHSAVTAGDAHGGFIMRSMFWTLVDDWLVGVMMDGIYAHAREWRDTDPVYSCARVAEIYADGQRLFALGRNEAAAYREWFTQRLEGEGLLNAANQQLVERELVRAFCEQVKRSNDAAFEQRGLYWTSIERWVRKRWMSGALTQDRNVLEAVQKLYVLDMELGKAYVSAYINFVRCAAVSPLKLVQTEFGRAVYAGLLDDEPGFIAERAVREMETQDFFSDSAALNRVLKYQEMMTSVPELATAYADFCESSLRQKIAYFKAQDAARLFRELDAPAGGIIDIYGRIAPGGDARGPLEAKLFELVKDDGIYLCYPAQPELAGKIAQFLDRRSGKRIWGERLRVLEAVHALDLNALDQKFDGLMEDGFDTWGDSVLFTKAQEQLWSAIQENFSENTGNMKALLMALALHNSCGGSFRPTGIKKDLSALDIPEKKLLAYCKHRNEPNASRGLGYVAHVMCGVLDPKRCEWEDVWVDYPGEEREEKVVGMFAGVPMAVAIASIFVFGGGLAASMIGILMNVGLL